MQMSWFRDFLSRIGNESAKPLTRIFLKIIENEMVPIDWKDANVIPVYKGETIRVLQLITDRLV